MRRSSRRAFTTVSSKQLQSDTIISIIGLHKSVCIPVIEDNSNLNINTYINYANEYQTPHTPSINSFLSLLENIKNFDIKREREKINNRMCALENVFGKRYDPPVYIIDKRDIKEEIAIKYDLYKIMGGYQIFTYAGSDEEFNNFIKDVS